jgi:hypothetical protein
MRNQSTHDAREGKAARCGGSPGGSFPVGSAGIAQNPWEFQHDRVEKKKNADRGPLPGGKALQYAGFQKRRPAKKAMIGLGTVA